MACVSFPHFRTILHLEAIPIALLVFSIFLSFSVLFFFFSSLLLFLLVICFFCIFSSSLLLIFSSSLLLFLNWLRNGPVRKTGRVKEKYHALEDKTKFDTILREFGIWTNVICDLCVQPFPGILLPLAARTSGKKKLSNKNRACLLDPWKPTRYVPRGLLSPLPGVWTPRFHDSAYG